jgi:hypothetical protein
MMPEPPATPLTATRRRREGLTRGSSLPAALLEVGVPRPHVLGGFSPACPDPVGRARRGAPTRAADMPHQTARGSWVPPPGTARAHHGAHAAAAGYRSAMPALVRLRDAALGDPGGHGGPAHATRRPARHHRRSHYVGLIPFRMSDSALGPRPALPYFGTFLETSVRLYSIDEYGRRGIVFRSLDADRLASSSAPASAWRCATSGHA